MGGECECGVLKTDPFCVVLVVLGEPWIRGAWFTRCVVLCYGVRTLLFPPSVNCEESLKGSKIDTGLGKWGKKREMRKRGRR